MRSILLSAVLFAVIVHCSAVIGKIYIGTPGQATPYPDLSFTYNEMVGTPNQELPVYVDANFQDDLNISCETTHTSLVGYTTLSFSFLYLTAGGSNNGIVKFVLRGEGRETGVRCFGVSQKTQGNLPEFVKETSYSDVITAVMTCETVVSVCDSVIEVLPVVGTKGTFKVSLTEVVIASEVDVICDYIPGAMELNVSITSPVTIPVGSISANIPYEVTALGNQSSFDCSAESKTGLQYISNTSTRSGSFIQSSKFVFLRPLSSEIKSTSFDVLLSLSSPVSESTGLDFYCSVNTFKDYDGVQNLQQNQACNPPLPAVSTSTTPTSTVALASTSTGSVVPTDILYSWAIATDSFNMKQNDIYHVLTVSRSSVTVTTTEYVGISCCVPQIQNNANIEYKDKQAFLSVFINIQPNVTVNRTAAPLESEATTERTIQNPGYQEYAPCPCDWVKNKCDVDCCCDSVCSESEKSTFKECIPGLQGGLPAPIEEYNCYSQHYPKDDWFPAMCVETESNPFLGMYYFNQQPARSSREFDAKVDASEAGFTYSDVEAPEDVLVDRPAGYTYGARLRTKGSGSSGTLDSLFGIMTLPIKTLSGQCIQTSPIGFLKEYSSSCVVPMTKSICSEDSVVSAKLYAQATLIAEKACPKSFNVLSGQSQSSTVVPTYVNYYCLDDSSIKSYKQGSSSTSISFSTIQPADYTQPTSSCSDVYGSNTCIDKPQVGIKIVTNQLPPRCEWDTGYSSPASPYFTYMYPPEYGQCTRMVLEVRYTFTYTANEITRLDANIIMAYKFTDENGFTKDLQIPFTTKISGIRYQTNITQKFEVKFVSSNETDGSVIQTRSGNPGYNVGKPLWSGYYNNQTGGTFAVDKSESYQLAVFDTDITGNCASGTLMKRHLNFGEDMLSSCNMYLVMQNFSDCDYLRKLVYNKLSVQLMTANFIGKLGYNDIDNETQWIGVNREDISFAFLPMNETDFFMTESNITLPNQTYTTEGICHNIPAGINLAVMYAESGKANDIPINEVVGAQISYTLGNWQYMCDSSSSVGCDGITLTNKPFLLTASVNYIKVPAKKVRDPIKYWKGYDPAICNEDMCWEELFYPLTASYSADSFQYSLGFSLLSFVFIIAFFIITNSVWYTFILVFDFVFFIVFYYMINFWIMKPTYL